MGIFNATQRLFPNATLHASDAFDDFITAVEPFKANLPLVTAEIGDTWSGFSSFSVIFNRKIPFFRAF